MVIQTTIFRNTTHVAATLQPPAHKSEVGHTIPHERPNGLSDKICFAAP